MSIDTAHAVEEIWLEIGTKMQATGTGVVTSSSH
jgi:hypothetical protein